MKVALVNPPYLDRRFSRSQRSPGVIRSGTMYYPYWLAHAAALLLHHGHQVLVLDPPATGISSDETIRALREFTPRMVVVETSTPSFEHDGNFVEALSEKLKGVPIILVGPHVSALAEMSLQSTPGATAVATAEYDLTVAELADALNSDADPLSVPGLIWRQDGEIQRSPRRQLLEDLDQLPWIAPVYKQFLDVRNYYFGLANFPMLMLISGRGCPSRCFYCVYPQIMHGHQYRVRSAEHLVGEMAWIERNLPQIREIVFEDDTFGASPRRTEAICEEILRRNIRLPWFANLRVNTSARLLKLMRRAGLRNCAVGFESGSPELLKAMRKGATVERARKFAEDARKAGVLVHGCFMVGFPGETTKTMEETLKFAKELRPDSAQFYPVFPYPGTAAHEWAAQNEHIAGENTRWLDAEGYHQAVISLPELSAAQMWDFSERAYRRYHFSAPYLSRKLKQALTDPSEGIRSLRTGARYLRYLFNQYRDAVPPTK